MEDGKNTAGVLRLLYFISCVVMGIILGILATRNVFTLPNPVLTFALFILSYILHIFIHEVGHLIFGLISGYKFCSIRFFSFTVVKIDGKIKLRLMSLPGTLGQCLMSPPDMKDGAFPVLLMNFGGAVMNLAASIFAILLFAILRRVYVPSAFLVIFAFLGLIICAHNAIPMRLSMVNNDGYNALSLRKNKDAMRSFWIMFQVNRLSQEGVRLRDMNSDWFCVPDNEAMTNSHVAALGVFSANRLMDGKKFEEARVLMQRLMSNDYPMAGLYRRLMICDLFYCDLVCDRRCGQVIDVYLSKEHRDFLRAMRNFPSVIRTEYAFSLLFEKNMAKAEKLKADFEKAAKSYPNPADIESERELMEYAWDVAQATQT